MNNNLKFAICITLPGTTELDVVHAAHLHNVHILDKLKFDPDKDYNSFTELHNKIDGVTIFPLFVNQDQSLLVDNSRSLKDEVEKIKML